VKSLDLPNLFELEATCQPWALGDILTDRPQPRIPKSSKKSRKTKRARKACKAARRKNRSS
jgi:hypothetical protein